MTASDGSCLIVRYFFITWESVATLNTLELLDNKVSANSSCEEFLIKSGGTVNPAAPARKASSKETALLRQEPRVKHGVDERRHT